MGKFFCINACVVLPNVVYLQHFSPKLKRGAREVVEQTNVRTWERPFCDTRRMPMEHEANLIAIRYLFTLYIIIEKQLNTPV